MNSIQLISDLHVDREQDGEIIKIPKLKPKIIVGGDVAELDQPNFLLQMKYFSDNWEHVYYIRGNHEFYGLSYDETIEKSEKLLGEFNNITILDRTVVRLEDNQYLLGCTLWSYIPKEHEQFISNYIRDYRMIKDFSIEFQNELHRRDKDWLLETIRQVRTENHKNKILVVTHHAPVFAKTSHPRYVKTASQYAFATDIPLDNVNYWLFGHTHFNITRRVGNTIIASRCFRHEDINMVKCLKCCDEIYSSHIYDCRSCRCGAISIDGGNVDTRVLGNREDYEWVL